MEGCGTHSQPARKGILLFPWNWLREDLVLRRFLAGYSFGEDCVYDFQQEVGSLLLELPKRFLGVQGIRLDQHPFQIQLAEELPQHGPLMVFVGGVAGLVIATPKAAEYSVIWAMTTDPPCEVGSKEPRGVLPSQISCATSDLGDGRVADRRTEQRAATSTCWKK